MRRSLEYNLDLIARVAEWEVLILKSVIVYLSQPSMYGLITGLRAH